jgi:hypothetical protein
MGGGETQLFRAARWLSNAESEQLKQSACEHSPHFDAWILRQDFKRGSPNVRDQGLEITASTATGSVSSRRPDKSKKRNAG